MKSNLIRHLKTINTHKKFVFESASKMGYPVLGLVHDLSKYSKQELSICKYYDGTKSPHAVARGVLGYSPSWLNHYHKNKHHWQFWLDMEDWPDKVLPIKMPYKYVIEMFCDFVGAGKAYMGKSWTNKAPWDYWYNSCGGKRLMHKDSEYLIKKLLWNMHELDTEKDFYKWYKEAKDYLKDNYNNGNTDY